MPNETINTPPAVAAPPPARPPATYEESAANAVEEIVRTMARTRLNPVDGVIVRQVEAAFVHGRGEFTLRLEYEQPLVAPLKAQGHERAAAVEAACREAALCTPEAAVLRGHAQSIASAQAALERCRQEQAAVNSALLDGPADALAARRARSRDQEAIYTERLARLRAEWPAVRAAFVRAAAAKTQPLRQAELSKIEAEKGDLGDLAARFLPLFAARAAWADLANPFAGSAQAEVLAGEMSPPAPPPEPLPPGAPLAGVLPPCAATVYATTHLDAGRPGIRRG
jgi:hypothetical protein